MWPGVSQGLAHVAEHTGLQSGSPPGVSVAPGATLVWGSGGRWRSWSCTRAILTVCLPLAVVPWETEASCSIFHHFFGEDVVVERQ